MRKELYVESWTQLLFLSKQYNSKINTFQNEKDIKKMSYPRMVAVVGNEHEQFIWT